MDIRKVKKLIELLDESGIAEIEITEGEESVRISRHAAGVPAMAAPMQMQMPIAAAPAAPEAAPAATPEADAAEPEEEGSAVTAPMLAAVSSEATFAETDAESDAVSLGVNVDCSTCSTLSSAR